MEEMKSSTIEYKANLDEVSIIRPILITLVVLYHSMAIHTGNWALPDGVTVISVYKAVGKLAYAFMLESFVFISGYVWAFQRERRGRKESLGVLCRKKTIRLLVPNIVFGLLYCFLLEGGKLTILHLLEGPGHLWFLPMLFECFLISWCILKTKVPLRVILPVLFIVGIIPPKDLPLRLSLTLYYLPFFMLGYYMNGKYEKLKENIRIKHILLTWFLFLISYFSMVECRSLLVVRVHQPMLLGGVFC